MQNIEKITKLKIQNSNKLQNTNFKIQINYKNQNTKIQMKLDVFSSTINNKFKYSKEENKTVFKNNYD